MAFGERMTRNGITDAGPPAHDVVSDDAKAQRAATAASQAAAQARILKGESPATFGSDA